jgi:glutamine synthetase
MIAPTATAEYRNLLAALESAKAVALPEGVVGIATAARAIGALIDELARATAALKQALASAEAEIPSAVQKLRTVVDALESKLPDDGWPLPKYREMLFIY